MTGETQMTLIDGREALGAMIVRPNPESDEEGRGILTEAWATGLTKRDMARILRVVADRFDEDADKEEQERSARINAADEAEPQHER